MRRREGMGEPTAWCWYVQDVDAAIIDRADFEAAQHDARVQNLHASAQVYAAELIASGHCPSHLVVNCDCAPAGR